VGFSSKEESLIFYPQDLLINQSDLLLAIARQNHNPKQKIVIDEVLQCPPQSLK
jgi:hypothetical protein